MRAVYLHSPRSDFAETQRMPVSSYLGRKLQPGNLRLFSCGSGCGKLELTRITRRPWMRLLPYFRLYVCLACGMRVLRTRIRQRPVYTGPVYLPAPPLADRR